MCYVDGGRQQDTANNICVHIYICVYITCTGVVVRMVSHVLLTMQVKPLLQVTNTEEKINQREAELKQVADKFDKLKTDHDDLQKQQKQIMDEKTALADQLQAEVELCNEAEEVIVN